jgi:hypothetical protein
VNEVKVEGSPPLECPFSLFELFNGDNEAIAVPSMVGVTGNRLVRMKGTILTGIATAAMSGKTAAQADDAAADL